MTGASLSGVMVTVVVCVAHRFGPPPSHTVTETSQLAGGVGPAGVKAYAPVPALMVPPHVSAGPMDHVAPGPSGSDAVALYVYATSSVAAGGVLVMTGASFTGVMVTVVVCVAHRSGDPPSQTLTSTTQLAGGVGPAGVKAYAPVLALMLPPHVSAGPTDQ